MHPIETVLLLLIFVIGLALFARRLNVVFPVLLTVAGLVIGFMPGLPTVVLDPSVVLLVFLPPILYSAAWYTNWLDFKRNLEPISVLALGLVLVTCVATAFVANWLIPGFTLATGFLLGAIVSPPDAVAATAVMQKVAVPKKVVTVLEGESLVNDATALVALQLSLATVATGTFSLGDSVVRFFVLAGGGIGVGLAVGYVSYLLHKHFELEPAMETMLTFVTAYSAYIAAERLHLSGVLSVVAAGLYIGRNQSSLHRSAMRIQAVAVWNFVVVLLNGLIFILIGLQLPHIVVAIQHESLGRLIGYGLLISAVAVLVRFGYIFLADATSNRIRRHLKLATVFPTKRHTTLLAFIGMRGVVSLAAALSIPETLPNGEPFPVRNLILFITFCVILVTLVGQGVTLPALIRALRFEKAADEQLSHRQVRRQLAEQALTSLRRVVSEDGFNDDTARTIIDWHRTKLNALDRLSDGPTPQQKPTHRLLRVAIDAQRQELLRLRDAHEIGTELFHELEYELDLDEARLEKSV